MLELLNAGAALIAGTFPSGPTFNPAYDRATGLLNDAVVELRRRGHAVAPADGIPGLWSVSGMPELTTSQLIAAAFPGAL